jgi:hypothetical protein
MVPCDGLLPVTRGPSPLQPILPCKSLRTSTRLAPGLNDLASTTDSDWLDRAIPHHVEHLVCQPVLFFQHLFLESVCCVVSSLQRDPEGPSQRRRRSSYTSQEEEEAVTPAKKKKRKQLHRAHATTSQRTLHFSFIQLGHGLGPRGHHGDGLVQT